MKCIPGVTTRIYCIKCKNIGRVVGYAKPMVYMECSCGEKWRTLSALCECCKLPSGTPYYADCVYCKDKKKKTADKHFERDYEKNINDDINLHCFLKPLN